MKVYICSTGDYSDYSVKGIYSTLEKAEYASRYHGWRNDIKEVDLDPETPYYDQEKVRWSLRYALHPGHQKIVYCELLAYNEHEWDDIPRNQLGYYPSYLYGIVRAVSEEAAQKIFMERVRAFLAGQIMADNGNIPAQDMMMIDREVVVVNHASTD